MYLRRILAFIGIALLRFVDSIYGVFQYLAGVGKVQVVKEDGTTSKESVNILTLITDQPEVQKIFFSVLMISILIGAVACMIAIIKTMKNAEYKSQGKILGQYFVSIFGTILLFGLFATIFTITANLLGLINDAFTQGNDISIGNSIMQSLYGEAEHKAGVQEGARHAHLITNGEKGDINGFAETKSVENVVNNLFGKFETSILGTEKVKYQNKDGEPIPYDYDKNHIPWGLDSSGEYIYIRQNFPFASLMIGAVILVISLVPSLFALAARVFNIVLLIFVAPIATSTYPLDDGAKFKEWRSSFMSQLLMAFGTIFALNLYIVMLPLIGRIKINTLNSSTGQTLETLFKFFLYICGAMTINSGQKLVSKILGSEGSEGKGLMKQGFATAKATLGTGFAGAKAIGRGIFGKKKDAKLDALKNIENSIGGVGGASGGTSASDRASSGRYQYKPKNIKGREGGLLANIGKAGNAIGRTLYGDRYVAKQREKAETKQANKEARYEKFMSQGGLVGGLRHKIVDKRMRGKEGFVMYDSKTLDADKKATAKAKGEAA